MLSKKLSQLVSSIRSSITNNKTASFVIFFAIVFRLIYLFITPSYIRSYDIYEYGGHFDYIHNLARDLKLPDPKDGWESFQPPLYYMFGAIVFVIIHYAFKLTGYQSEGIGDFVNVHATSLQLLSLVFSIIFLIYSYKIIKLFASKANVSSIALFVIAFWPVSIIHSIRIGNDSLFYTLFVASLYYILVYLQTSKGLQIASIFVGLSLVTKSNGLILALILVIAILSNNLITRKISLQKPKDITLKPTTKTNLIFHFSKSIKTILGSLAVVGAFYIINIGRTLYSAVTNGTDWLVASEDMIDTRLRAINSWANFLTFNPINFYSTLFTNTRIDEFRNNFWYFLLKTSMFGEFEFWNNATSKANGTLQASPLVEYLYFAISICVILIVILLLFGLFQDIKSWKKNLISGSNLKPRAFLWLTIIVSIAALMFYRFKLPFTSNNDFRYIYPIVLPISILILIPPATELKLGRIIRRFGTTLLVISSILSIAFWGSIDKSINTSSRARIPSWALAEDLSGYRKFYKNNPLNFQLDFDQEDKEKFFLENKMDLFLDTKTNQRVTKLDQNCKKSLFINESKVYSYYGNFQTNEYYPALQKELDEIEQESTTKGTCNVPFDIDSASRLYFYEQQLGGFGLFPIFETKPDLDIRAKQLSTICQKNIIRNFVKLQLQKESKDNKELGEDTIIVEDNTQNNSKSATLPDPESKESKERLILEYDRLALESLVSIEDESKSKGECTLMPIPEYNYVLENFQIDEKLFLDEFSKGFSNIKMDPAMPALSPAQLEQIKRISNLTPICQKAIFRLNEQSKENDNQKANDEERTLKKLKKTTKKSKSKDQPKEQLNDQNQTNSGDMPSESELQILFEKDNEIMKNNLPLIENEFATTGTCKPLTSITIGKKILQLNNK